MKFDINLREDFVEHFIEKIYLQLDTIKRVNFIDNFIIKLDKNNIDFRDISKVVLKIISSYHSEYKLKQLHATLANEYFKDVKLLVDDYLHKYQLIR